MVINWMGSGMDSYTASFSTYLMKSTVGKLCNIKEIILKIVCHQLMDIL